MDACGRHQNAWPTGSQYVAQQPQDRPLKSQRRAVTWDYFKKGFEGKKNADLWKRFWALYQQHHVTLEWVKGHGGNTYNELCDLLATTAIKEGPWDIDEAYEKKF